MVRFSNGVESVHNSAYGIGILVVEPINSHKNTRSGCCRDFKDAAAANLIEGGKTILNYPYIGITFANKFDLENELSPYLLKKLCDPWGGLGIVLAEDTGDHQVFAVDNKIIRNFPPPGAKDVGSPLLSVLSLGAPQKQASFLFKLSNTC